MASTDFISVPAGLLTKRQRRALLVEQPSIVLAEYIDTKQLSEAINVSERTVEKWREDRIIPFLKVGHVIRFDLAAVKRALERHIVHPKDSAKSIPPRKATIVAHEPTRYAREPEFVDSHSLKAIYGINRSLAYVLAQEGLIQSVSIRRPGALRGKRLWRVASVRRYLDKLERDQRVKKTTLAEVVKDVAKV